MEKTVTVFVQDSVNEWSVWNRTQELPEIKYKLNQAPVSEELCRLFEAKITLNGDKVEWVPKAGLR